MNTLLVLLLLLAPGAAHAQMNSTGTFVHLTSRRWHTFDPANAFDSVSHIVTANVYETLVTFKSVVETDRYEPFLAAQVPSFENGLLSKDGTIYTFPIRSGVRFHDGSLMTAEDVRYSLLRFMLLDTEGGPAALLLRPILGVSSTRDASGKRIVSYKDAARAVAVKDETVVVTLKKPDSTFLKLLASLPIVASRRWAAANKDWDGTEAGLKAFNGLPADRTFLHEHVNGTGPFRLESADEEGLVLARHDGYWRKPAALERVHFKVVPNDGLRLFMLQTGDADSSFLEIALRPYAKAAKGLRLVGDLPDHELGDILFFGFKTDAGSELIGSGKLDGRGVPPDFFGDPDVRRGFAWAFDYQKYLKAAMGGEGRRVSGPFPADLVPAPKGGSFTRDPRKAEEALRKAYNGEVWAKGFVVSAAYSANSSSRRAAAEALRDGLRALNPLFKVNIHPLPSGEYYGALEHRMLPLFLNGYYADYPDPHSYAFGLLHGDSYFPKYQGFADARIDALLDEAQGSPDSAARRDLYARAAALGAEDLPHFYTYAAAPLRVYGAWVAGYDSKDNVGNLNYNNFPYFYAYSKPLKP